MARGRKGIAVRTKRMAVCALFCALGVVLLYLGALTEVLDLAVAMLVSMLMIPIMFEYGGIYPYLVWTVTGILGLVLYPSSWATQIYAGFLGYYPLVKHQIERVRVKPLAWFLKFATFNTALAIYMVLIFLILGKTGDFFDAMWAYLGDFGDLPTSNWWLLAVLLLFEVMFVMYDVMLSKVVLLYWYKFRQKIKKHM